MTRNRSGEATKENMTVSFNNVVGAQNNSTTMMASSAGNARSTKDRALSVVSEMPPR